MDLTHRIVCRGLVVILTTIRICDNCNQLVQSACAAPAPVSWRCCQFAPIGWARTGRHSGKCRPAAVSARPKTVHRCLSDFRWLRRITKCQHCCGSQRRPCGEKSSKSEAGGSHAANLAENVAPAALLPRHNVPRCRSTRTAQSVFVLPPPSPAEQRTDVRATQERRGMHLLPATTCSAPPTVSGCTAQESQT